MLTTPLSRLFRLSRAVLNPPQCSLGLDRHYQGTPAAQVNVVVGVAAGMVVARSV